MQSPSIDDNYLTRFSWGSEAGADILLFIVATLTPAWDQDSPPRDGDGAPIFASESGRLSAAGKILVAQQMSRLSSALTRPFHDDDCPYGHEYGEGETIPLRFVAGSDQSKLTETSLFLWMPAGGESEEDRETGVGFYDPTSQRFSVAFLITLQRLSKSDAHLLYADHVAPYLSLPDCEVQIYAAGDRESSFTAQSIRTGRVAERHQDASARAKLDRFQFSAKEYQALTLCAPPEGQTETALKTAGKQRSNSSDQPKRTAAITTHTGIEIALEDHTELLKNKKNSQRWTMAETPSTPISQLVYLARFDNYRMAKNAARRTLAAMAADVCSSQKLMSYLDSDRQLQGAPYSSYERLLLAFSSDSEIRKIIANQKRIPLEIIEVLCADEEGAIRFAARQSRDGFASWEV
jgi:hypothetical protein